ncbi:MAG: hypothetical protein WCJ54_05405, partial [Actinomycetota bacterium]
NLFIVIVIVFCIFLLFYFLCFKDNEFIDFESFCQVLSKLFKSNGSDGSSFEKCLNSMLSFKM